MKNIKKINKKNISKYLKRFKLLIIFIALLAFASLIYYFKGLFIVAIINNKPISRIALIKKLESTYGKQTIDSLINKELILQEAKRKSISISDSEINAEIENIKKMLESQGTNLDEALAGQGQTLDSLNENIYLKKMIEKLLVNELKVTEDEAKKYFEDNKQYYDKNTKYDDIKSQIKDTLVQEKFNTEVQKFIDKLRTEGKIYQIVKY